MTIVLSILSILLTRLLFIGHGAVAVYTLLHHKPHHHHPPHTHYYIPFVPLGCLCIETLTTLWNQHATRCRYFWPCGFFYLTTIIPVVWIIELEQYHQEPLRASSENNSTSLMDDVHDQEEHHHPYMQLLNFVKLNKHDLVSNVCEVGLFIGLIVGRWLLPRGPLSRDQLSALLMSYTGASADILEIFELLEQNKKQGQRITYAALSLYTVATLQFSLETTLVADDKNKVNTEGVIKTLSEKTSAQRFAEQRYKRHEENSSRITMKKKNKVSKQIHSEKCLTPEQLHIKPNPDLKKYQAVKNLQVNVRVKSKMEQKIAESKAAREREMEEKRQEMRAEVFQILVTLLMQDIPFLLMRVHLIVWYHKTSETHLFYTCKNFLVTALLVYRLYILKTDEENVPRVSDEEGKGEVYNKLRALQHLSCANETVNSQCNSWRSRQMPQPLAQETVPATHSVPQKGEGKSME